MPITAPTTWSNEVDKHQNPWAVMNDYSKTVITLASSILAVTATFATSLLGSNPSLGLWICLLASWALLIGAIVGALFVTASLTNYLRGTKTSTWGASLASNLSFFALASALLCFAILGLVRLWPGAPKPDIVAAINTVTAFKSYPDIPAEVTRDTAIESIQWESKANQWTAEVRLTYSLNGRQLDQRFLTCVDAAGTRILAIKKLH